MEGILSASLVAGLAWKRGSGALSQVPWTAEGQSSLRRRGGMSQDNPPLSMPIPDPIAAKLRTFAN
jgi:hypothetical protein